MDITIRKHPTSKNIIAGAVFLAPNVLEVDSITAF